MNLVSAAMAQDSTPPAAPAPEAAPAVPHPAPAQPAAPAAPPTTTSVGAPQPVDPNAPPPPTMPEVFQQLVPIFVVMGIIYIMVIRPRARKEREEQESLRNVRRGDVVATTAGFVGKVTRAIDDNEVEFELAPNVRARLLRSAIVEVRSRGEPVRDTPAETPKAAEPAKTEAKPAARASKSGRSGTKG